ncbi:uncharacterized protein LOC134182065 isoform X2 [Corticium candelabrum]|nr:uncharacterized protein LOC134182065 isoform X2 [Corticium candelabrum]
MPELLDLVREKALSQLPNEKATVTVDDVSDRDRRAAALAGKVAIQQILKKQAMAKAQESGKEGTADIKAKAIEIAGEVASKALDSAFGAISDAKNRSANQLMNGAKVNVKLDESFQGKSVIYPGDTSLNVDFDNDPIVPEQESQEQPLYYMGGTGAMVQNSCFDTDFPPDPECYEGATGGAVCSTILDAASFIGVGFDGRSEYNAKSRKLSLIQRDCSAGKSYDGKQVPNSMMVQGIYDTEANTFVFGSREEYRRYLEEGAAVGESIVFFADALKNAYGEASSETKEMYLAIMDINIIRYEIFLDRVIPDNLNPSFLHDFMSLPTSFDGPGHASQFIDFILRWGTHYVKSSPVGGQLELRKATGVSVTQDIDAFAREARKDFQGIFRSSHARDYLETSQENKVKQEAQGLSMNAQGGEQHIGALLSDMYGPGFKTALVSWLESLVTYPKPFDFTLGRISDLVNFKESELFPSEDTYLVERWGCEAKKAAGELETDEISGEQYYTYQEEVIKPDGTVESVTKRKYCKYLSREELTKVIAQRRRALDKAISIYLEEGPISTADTFVPGTGVGCTTPYRSQSLPEDVPTWDELTGPDGYEEFHISFDMQATLYGSGGRIIPAKSGHDVVYKDKKWYKKSQDGLVHLYNGFDNGNSGNLASQRVSILGLVLDYNDEDGTLYLTEDAYEASDIWHSSEASNLVNMSLAFFNPETIADIITPESPIPCNVHWSNIDRMAIDYCLKFSASSTSTIFVVLAAVPRLIDTWYYVRMARDEASIHKANKKIVSTLTKNAASIATKDLYRNYLVCAREDEYGEFQLYHGLQSDDLVGGTVLLPFYDIAGAAHYPLRFFAFGCGNDDVRITDVSVVPYNELNIECGTGVVGQKEKCLQERCGEECREAGCVEYINSEGEMDYTCSGTINPRDCPCACILENNPESVSGVYTISVKDYDFPFDVYCDMTSEGGGWTVFQMRFDGTIDFTRNAFADYEEGFGNARRGEYWLGFERLYLLLNIHREQKNQLRIEVEDWEGHKAHSIYQNFELSDGDYKFNAEYSSGVSTAGDGYSKYSENGKAFLAHCSNPDKVGGGHWKADGCNSYANLNGIYYPEEHKFYQDVSVTRNIDGVVWPTDWSSDRPPGTCSQCSEYYSLKKTSMSFRQVG